MGKHFVVPTWPHALTLSRDRKTAFVVSKESGNIFRNWESGTPTITPLEPRMDADETKQKKRRGETRVAVLSADGSRLFWSSGDSGEIVVYDTTTGKPIGDIELNTPVNGRKFEDSVAMDLKLSDDGRVLYIADMTNFRVVIADTQSRKILSSIDVGRYPYALTVVKNRVYVANIGMFQYTAVPKPDPNLSANLSQKPDPRGLTRPPFGYPSKESEEGVTFEGRKIAGLGKPNVPESFSVWGIDVENPSQPKITRKIKTGLLVGAVSDHGKTIGGSAPNFVVNDDSALYVSNGNNDIIEKIDLKTEKVILKRRLVASPLVARLRGVAPTGMTLSPDGKRLYVAESGLNAIAVLDTRSLQILGHIPTAWYPYRLGVSADGKSLLCINFRGFGNGPNAGRERPQSAFLGMRGAVTVLATPSTKELPSLTQRVLENNGLVDRSEAREAMSSKPIPTLPGTRSEQIKYVVFITKENHTYDTVFDRIPGAKHDPSLLRWGYKQTISAPNQPTLNDVAIMTNHNALARQFTVSDNFYMQPEASGVGHRWLVGIQPNNMNQMLYTIGYDFKVNTTAPGRMASYGSNGSQTPEDYPEAGSMWEHLARGGMTFRNYGEGFEFAGVAEDEDEEKTGAREVVNFPMSKVLYDNTCWEFPIFNMNIPDQYRAYWFELDFKRLFLTGKKQMPNFINICICNDHGAGPKPEKGFPYVASWMADNDLAMGRIIDFLSHTKYWKNMAIFVTQDDSGGEPDHVDAQRSVLMVISPWAKRGYVSHRHTTILSMHRTLYQIFGLKPLNLFDAIANDFADCFTDKPDFTPYKYVPVDPRIFDPEKAKNPKDPHYMEARKQSSILRDAPAEEARVLKLVEEEQRRRP
jgi:YVTN family beta-propeller protein